MRFDTCHRKKKSDFSRIWILWIIMSWLQNEYIWNHVWSRDIPLHNCTNQSQAIGGPIHLTSQKLIFAHFGAFEWLLHQIMPMCPCHFKISRWIVVSSLPHAPLPPPSLSRIMVKEITRMENILWFSKNDNFNLSVTARFPQNMTSHSFKMVEETWDLVMWCK